MIESPGKLLRDFVQATHLQYGIIICVDDILHQQLIAPHDPADLPRGKGAVYAFTLLANTTAPAGKNRALKVGKAGPNSNARFRYQHYKSGSARSTLAGAIENNLILLPYIGIEKVPEDIGVWIKANTDRDNFFVEGNRQDVLSLLEVYLKGYIGPVFEGSLSSFAGITSE